MCQVTLVWLHDPVNARHKLEPNWTGPYSILTSLHDGLNYQIEDIHNPERKKVVHHNRLKIFRRCEPRKHTPPSSQPSSIGRQTRPSDCTLPSSFSNQEQPSDCTLPSSFTSTPGSTIEWVLESPGHQPQPLNQPDENGDGQPLNTDHQRQADGSRDGDGQHLTDHRHGDDRNDGQQPPNHDQQPVNDGPEPPHQPHQPPQPLQQGPNTSCGELPADGSFNAQGLNQPRQPIQQQGLHRTDGSYNTQGPDHPDPQQQTIQQPQLDDADQQLPSASGNHGNEQQAPQRTSRYGRKIQQPSRFRDYQQ